MKIGLTDEADQRARDLIAALDRMTAALEANTAAVDALDVTRRVANEQRDFLMNGPRG